MGPSVSKFRFSTGCKADGAWWTCMEEEKLSTHHGQEAAEEEVLSRGKITPKSHSTDPLPPTRPHLLMTLSVINSSLD